MTAPIHNWVVDVGGLSIGTEYRYVGTERGAVRYAHRLAREADPSHDVWLYRAHALFGLASKPTLKLRGTGRAA